MTRVLVTGSLGYIGSVLTPFLTDRGYGCVGYDAGLFRDCQLYPPRDTETRLVDARDITEQDLAGIDAVVHLAGISNDPVGAMEASQVYEPARTHARVIASMCRQKGVRFIFASSCSVYGLGHDTLLDEASPTFPQTPYSLNKLQVEEDLRALSGPDFSPVALRFATVFGLSPRIRFDVVVNMLTGMAATCRQIVLNSDGTPWRPLVHILDVCEAVRRAIDTDHRAGDLLTVNVGTETNNLRVLDIARTVQDAVPGCELRFLAQRPDLDPDGLVQDRKVAGGVDTRTYRVSFAKSRTVFPGFACAWSVAQGAGEMAAAFPRMGLSAERFRSRGFYRLQHLEDLLRDGYLSREFRWLKDRPPLSPALPAPRAALPGRTSKEPV